MPAGKMGGQFDCGPSTGAVDLASFVDLAPVPDDVHGEYLVSLIKRVQRPETTNAQFEKALPVTGQRFGCQGLKVVRQPAESVENTLGGGSVQMGQVIQSLRCKL
jgi:hypothetical protein